MFQRPQSSEKQLRAAPSAGSGAQGACADVTDVPGCELEGFLALQVLLGQRGCAAASLSSVPDPCQWDPKAIRGCWHQGCAQG